MSRRAMVKLGRRLFSLAAYFPVREEQGLIILKEGT